MSKLTTHVARLSVPALMEHIEGRQYMSYFPTAPSRTDFSSAIAMGTISNTAKSKTNQVGSNDREDFFSFRVSASGNVNVKLSGQRADADLTVFNSSGAQIANSNHASTTSESITKRLGKGTYYARVHSYDGTTTGYKLSVRRTNSVPSNPVSPVVPPPAPPTSDPISDSGAFDHQVDWFYRQFTVTGTLPLRVDFQSTWAADLMIVDNTTDRDNFLNGNVAYGYAIFNNQTGHDYVTLSSGTYWVVVRSESSGVNGWAYSVTQA